MRTQVAIIGGGPSGLLLSLLLHQRGIHSVVIERRSREHVLSRIRAGVLENGTVDLLRQAGVASRLDKEGQIHDGALLTRGNERLRVDFQEGAGKKVVVYGQTELTRDLYEAREQAGLSTWFNADKVVIENPTESSPSVSWTGPGQADADDPAKPRQLQCEKIVGCDGFRGVSRMTIPLDVRREYEKIYPFSWLGVLSQSSPVHPELIYASSERGFALCSMRSNVMSRYYIQCPANDSTDKWSDQAFWNELRQRIPDEFADQLVTGPVIEKSIAPLRSFVSEPMSWGNLYLCGDAAHIVPPTGAKGLNLAIGDVHYLAGAMDRFYNHGDANGLEHYSSTALARVWQATRFSWWMTSLLHHFPEQNVFDQRLQGAEFNQLLDSEDARAVLAQNYTGLAY